MRIPNHLRLASSHVWHFRQVVPADLQDFFGRSTLMRSLRATDLLTAQRRALEWAQQYAQAFATARRQGVGKESMPIVDEILRSAKRKKTEPYGAIQIEAR